VAEKGSEYILAHTGPRELDGRPKGRAWVGGRAARAHSVTFALIWTFSLTRIGNLRLVSLYFVSLRPPTGPL